MSRRGKKKGRPVSGWVILDKPVGMGSTEAVSKIKWLFQADKAGHAGTLDPLASGMLPIALGEATKTVPYVMDGAKVYRFTVAWGEERSTDDLEGPVTKSSDSGLKKRKSARCCRNTPASSCRRRRNSRQSRSPANAPTTSPATAKRSTSPPARSRSAVSTCSRPTPEGRTIFEIECGKGTYVRSLARDIGRDLGCYGHIAELRRIEVEPFTAEDLVTLAELEAAPPKREAPRKRRSYDDRFAAIDAYSRRHRRCARLPAAVHRHRRRGVAHPARQSGHPARPRCARRGRRGLRDGARQAGGDRRHRGRHVQAEAGFCG